MILHVLAFDLDYLSYYINSNTGINYNLADILDTT